MWSIRSCASSEHRLAFKIFKIPIGDGEEADGGEEKTVALEGRSVCKKRNRSDARMKGAEINGGSGCCSKVSTDDHEVKCAVCSRCFRSLKAMHGHMRWHPERERRGVNAPPPLLPFAKPAAPSSPVSSLTSTELLSDVSRPLKNRRYALFSAEETLTLTLTLALPLPPPPSASKNVDSDNSSVTFSNYIICSDQKEIDGKKLQELKNEIVGEGAYCSSGLSGQEDSWKNFLRLGLNTYEADDVTSTTTNKKEAVKQGAHNHRCRTCGKVFATGQALGGHQTTHRRKSVQQHPEVSGQNAASTLGVLNFDLNELPPDFCCGW